MKKTAARVILVFIIILTGVFLFLRYAYYSEGVRAGMVIKVSKKGVVFKTWEGQLNLQSFGATNSRNALAEVFEFSIEKGDTAAYNTLQDVSLTGERINLHYKQKYAVLPWLGDTKYFVTKIDRLPQPKDPPERQDPFREERE
jgi:hypothetical protein